jgi:hypothetical protein
MHDLLLPWGEVLVCWWYIDFVVVAVDVAVVVGVGEAVECW